MAQINLRITSASLLETPPTGFVTLFADSNKGGLLTTKLDTGATGSSSILNAVSSSYAVTASLVTYADSASYAITSSFATTASFTQRAISSSYAVSASYAVTASLVDYALFAKKIAYTKTAATASGYAGNLSSIYGDILMTDPNVSVDTCYWRTFAINSRIFVAGVYNANYFIGGGMYLSSANLIRTTDLPISSRPSRFTKLMNAASGLAALGDGKIYYAGENAAGEAGNGTTTTPVSTMAPNTNASLYGTGKTVLDLWQGSDDTTDTGTPKYFFAKVNDNGTLKYYCWGHNTNGQLGIGNTTNQTSPQLLSTFTGHDMTFYLGRSSTFAVSSSGELFAAGYNTSGQLGIGNSTDQTSFTQAINTDNTPVTDCEYVYNQLGFNAAATTYYGSTSLMKTKDGKVKAVGENQFYQLGIGNNTDQNKWDYVARSTDDAALSNIVAYKGGKFQNNAALDASGSLWAWGYNYNGWFGSGVANNTLYSKATVVAQNVVDFWPLSNSRGNYFGRSMFVNIMENGRPVTYAAGGNTVNNYMLGIGDTSTQYVISRQRVMYKDPDEYAVDIRLIGRESNSGTNYLATFHKTNKNRLYIAGNVGAAGGCVYPYPDTTFTVYTVAVPVQITDIPL